MVDTDTTITAYCPNYQHAVELLGRRWTGAIVRVMLSGATRFVDVACAIPGVTDRLVSERLKELEAEGIVVRTVIPSTPVRIDYHLTAKGRALAGIVMAISDWAHDWVTDTPAAPAEAADAGTPRG